MEKYVMAMIALSAPAALDGAALVGEVQRIRPELAASVLAQPGPETLMLNIGGSNFAVMAQPIPIPASEWLELSRSAMGWPDAEAALRQHSAHVVVSAMGTPAGGAAMREAMLALTAVTGAVARQHASVGVLMASSGVLTETNEFLALLESTGKGRLPVESWVRFEFIRANDGGIGGMTTGLANFIDREVELAPVFASPREAGLRLLGLANYLALSEQPIRDGDTVELVGERLRVHFAAQGRRPGIPVLAVSREKR
jgi:hypothetical protein